MNRLLRLAVLPLLAVSLAGCENDAASYHIDGDKDHAIALLREQGMVFGAVEQRFVVSRIPECQRRFTVEPGAADMTPIEIYRVAPMLFVARQGKTWYALGTEACQVQTFRPEDRPAEPPGSMVGRFEKKAGQLVFVPAPTESGPAQ